MTEGGSAALLAAVAGGYLLGRTKKARFALAVASWGLGRKYGLTPAALVAQGAAALRTSPQAAQLADQVRGELLSAGRSAVSAAVNRRCAALADSLGDRTRTLRGEPDGAPPREEAAAPARRPPPKKTPARPTARSAAKAAAKKPPVKRSAVEGRPPVRGTGGDG